MSGTKSKKLTPKQMKALVAIASGLTHKKAAELVGVNENTIGVWTRLPIFSREFQKTMERMRYQFEARVVAAGQDAVAVIHKELDNKDVDVRLKAGVALANNAVRVGTRYKELESAGALPSQTPMIVFPAGTVLPWNSTPISVATPDVVDAEEVKELPESTEDSDGD
jgi:hypothetical protein